LSKKKLEKGEEYNVVDDQVRTPTYVEDLAKGLFRLLKKKPQDFSSFGERYFNSFSNGDENCRKHLHFDSSVIKKVTAASFTQPARRPLKQGSLLTRQKKNWDMNL
jgi:dTDP-4-dehydrorhamnose reductase